jgi:hypothetical protein
MFQIPLKLFVKESLGNSSNPIYVYSAVRSEVQNSMTFPKSARTNKKAKKRHISGWKERNFYEEKLKRKKEKSET